MILSSSIFTEKNLRAGWTDIFQYIWYIRYEIRLWINIENFWIFANEIHELYPLYAFFVHEIERVFVYIVLDVAVDKISLCL